MGAAAADAPPLSRLFIRDRGQIVPLRTDEIERLEGEDDYVALFARGRRHLVYLTLSEFERRLDPDRFLRIHRSHIVNLDHVAALVPYDGTRLQVRMRDGTAVIASRTCSRQLRQLAI
jgi:two-component system LytT family response regulator